MQIIQVNGTTIRRESRPFNLGWSKPSEIGLRTKVGDFRKALRNQSEKYHDAHIQEYKRLKPR